MTGARVFQAAFFEKGDATFLARLRYQGALVVIANVSSIAANVQRYHRATGAKETTHTSAPVVASTIFNTLQTDERWTIDTTGFNFAATIPAAAFPGDDPYFIVFTLTMTSGGVMQVAYEGPAVSLRGLV